MMSSIIRALIIIVVLLLLWQLIVYLGKLPPYLLPTPFAVFQTLYVQHILIFDQAKITVLETLIGLILGTLLGSFAAIIITIFKPLRVWLLPILILSQAIPTFAIAPLLVLWLGYGLASKIAMTTLVIFFPIVSTFYDGLIKTPRLSLDLAKTMQATRWRRLLRIQIPAALPNFASGLRVATAFAPIAAVVGEWVGSSQGLGFLMLNANARMEITTMFSALMLLITFTLVLYYGMDILLKKIIWW